jgi:hypothetical protein
MLTVSNLIHLPYTPDLTNAGVAYACRSLACSWNIRGGAPVEQLRHTVADVAVELAFRHHLSRQDIPIHVLDATPFTHLDWHDISLGGHRCMVKSLLISRRDQITQLHRDPAIMLQAPALLPVDQFAAEDQKPDDLYLFAFFLGVVAAGQTDVSKAIAARQPVFLIHLLPLAWTRPANWIPLENLALKSECAAPVTVEIGGQDAGRNFITARLDLPPRQRMSVKESFHSLAYIHVQRRPEARIGIHSPLHGAPYVIPAHAWGNLWVYGMDIILTGWITHEEYRRKARVLNAGRRTFPFEQTPSKSLLVPVSELNPLGRLLEKVRQWEVEKAVRNRVEAEKHP